MAGYIDGKVDIWYGVNPPLNNNILWMQRSQPYNFEASSLYEFNNQTNSWVMFSKADAPVVDSLTSSDGLAGLSANQGRVLNISKVSVPDVAVDGEIVTFDGSTGQIVSSSGLTTAELQLISNKVTAWSTPLDTQYPSAKLVKDSLNAVEVSRWEASGAQIIPKLSKHIPSSVVDNLPAPGLIDVIKVNSVVQAITDKTVDIAVPAQLTVAQTTGTSTTSVMSQNAVTDAIANSKETLTSVGALIGTAGDATPLDSDNIATALSAGGILKKLTWTAAKAFLKTYFDTLYLVATKRWGLNDISTFNVNSTPTISPDFISALYKVDASYAGNRAISWTDAVNYNFPTTDSCTIVYLKNTDTSDRVHAIQTATYTYNTIVYTFTDMIGGVITVPAGKVLEICYLFVHSTTGCRVNVIAKIQA